MVARPRDRRPDLPRATAATTGSAGTGSWATSSTTSSGSSRPVTTGQEGVQLGHLRPELGRRQGLASRPRSAAGPDAFLFGETLVDGELKRFNLSKQQADKRVRPAGEWNVFEVTCKGKDVALWVNGEVVNEWHDCEVPKGFVGLEAEGYRIEFRNVKVKPL